MYKIKDVMQVYPEDTAIIILTKNICNGYAKKNYSTEFNNMIDFKIGKDKVLLIYRYMKNDYFGKMQYLMDEVEIILTKNICEGIKKYAEVYEYKSYLSYIIYNENGNWVEAKKYFENNCFIELKKQQIKISRIKNIFKNIEFDNKSIFINEIEDRIKRIKKSCEDYSKNNYDEFFAKPF